MAIACRDYEEMTTWSQGRIRLSRSASSEYLVEPPT